MTPPPTIRHHHRPPTTTPDTRGGRPGPLLFRRPAIESAVAVAG
jgi:hypothetical protein